MNSRDSSYSTARLALFLPESKRLQMDYTTHQGLIEDIESVVRR